jgi:hypothetical protein
MILDRMIGFTDPSLYNLSLNYNQYNTVADLHTFQFTVVHALGVAVATSRILATELNTGTITSNHYEVFLSWDCRLPEFRSTTTQISISISSLISSQSVLHYDRRSVGQSVLVSSPHLGLMTRFFHCQTIAGF